MKKVYQTIFGEPNGNCFQACIASMLECKLKDLPNFMEDGPDSFEGNLKEWESAMPFKLFDVRFEDAESGDFAIKDLLLIATIENMYTARAHAVIMKNGEIMHDPMPENKRNNRKISEPIYYTVFVPKEPQQYFGKIKYDGGYKAGYDLGYEHGIKQRKRMKKLEKIRRKENDTARS